MKGLMIKTLMKFNINEKIYDKMWSNGIKFNERSSETRPEINDKMLMLNHYFYYLTYLKKVKKVKIV